MKKVFLTVALVLLIAAVLPAQNTVPITITAYPSVLIPVGPGLESNNGETPYSTGGGVVLAGNLDPGNKGGFFGRTALGFSFLPITDGTFGDTDDLSILSLGLGAGYAVPIGGDIASLRLNAGGGLYQAMLADAASSNLFASAGAELAFPLSANFSLGVGAEYSRFLGGGGNGLPDYLYDGLALQIGTTFSFDSSQRQSRIEIIDIEVDPVYPILLGYYDTNPLGRVTLKNGEPRTIENLRVSLFIPQYMNKPKYSEPVSTLKRGETVTIPLYALLTDEILNVTEDGKRVSAEVKIEYDYRSDDLAAASSATAVVQNRNALTWSDDRKAAAFVTAKDNTILRFAKQVAGTVRDADRNALDENFRKAMAVYQSLGLMEMEYVIDPDSSYIELSENAAVQDYVQFPAQTLDYRAGDCDDLSILYNALLEAVNVETAFITVPGHIYTAFALSITPDEARRTFADTDSLIIRDEKVWVPVEATVMDQGFEAAWRIGVRQWNEHNPAGNTGFFPVRSAWRVYQPVASPLADPGIAVPEPRMIAASYNTTLDEIVTDQIGSRVARLEQQIRDSGGNNALRNRLGVLYARYGLYEDAMDEFQVLAERFNYGPAMVNAANIHYMRGDYAVALRFYSDAAEVLDNDVTARLGIARAHYKLENYGEAERSYTAVAQADPELAERFAHLGGGSTGTARASSAAVSAPAVWEE